MFLTDKWRICDTHACNHTCHSPLGQWRHTKNRFVQDYPVNRNIWSAVVEEILTCKRQPTNYYDRHTVTIYVRT